LAVGVDLQEITALTTAPTTAVTTQTIIGYSLVWHRLGVDVPATTTSRVGNMLLAH
jgi:hypothetical protein